MKKFIVEKFLLEIDRLDASEVIDEHLIECDMMNLMHHHFGHDDDEQPEEDGIDKSSFEHHGKDDDSEIDLDKGEDWGSKELDSDKELNNNSDNNSSFESTDDITDEDPYEYKDKDDIEDELTEAFMTEEELEEQKLPMMGVANQNNPAAASALAASKRAKEMALKMMANKKK